MSFYASPMSNLEKKMFTYNSVLSSFNKLEAQVKTTEISPDLKQNANNH